MKTFFVIILILFINTCNSQTKPKLDDKDLVKARKHWKSFFEYAVENPSIFNNPHLKLVDYELLDEDHDMGIEDFLRLPIDSLQVIPKMVISEEMVKQINEGEYAESKIELVVFSKMPLKEQYGYIAQKIHLTTESLFKKEDIKLVKLNWKYFDNLFHTYCVVSDRDYKMKYDIIFSNLQVYIVSGKEQ
ncbi:hypothetical protein [Mariniflexile sp. HMF6888]|uniref:hypothetical protein n=1 Tax=Mariniflexile sp. HMF6888 TaxID=3373086 RepID=UPI0037BDBC2A